MKESWAYAPASIANVGCLFAIGGVALDKPGDVVHAEKTEQSKGVNLVDIVKDPGLPRDGTNVSVAVANEVLERSGEDIGINLTLYKNMKIGTGMGSSASSGVASAVAVNALLDKPFSLSDKVMRDAVVCGEGVANGGPKHANNPFPSLFGGLNLIDEEHDFD